MTDQDARIRMLPITVPVLTGCEYGCVEADFGAKNLIFVLTPEGVFESTYPLDDANLALDDLRGGKVQGAAVLVV